VRVLRSHTQPVRCLAYFRDGRLLASGGEDGVVRVWDLARGAEVPEPNMRCPAVEVLAFAPDGGHYALGTAAGHLARWEEGGNSVIRGEVHAGGVSALAFSGNGATLFSAGWDRTLRAVDPKTLRDRIVSKELSSPVKALAWLADAALLGAGAYDGAVHLFDAGLTRRGTLATPAPVLTLAVSRDGSLLAAGHDDGTITVGTSVPGSPRIVLTGHSGPVYGLALAADGRSLVSGGADGTVRLWDVPTRRERQAFRWQTSWVTCVAIAPDGLTAAAGSDDTSVVVWDLDGD
jgi:hypothetical protein